MAHGTRGWSMQFGAQEPGFRGPFFDAGGAVMPADGTEQWTSMMMVEVCFEDSGVGNSRKDSSTDRHRISRDTSRARVMFFVKTFSFFALLGMRILKDLLE
ncbi:predicted protein [Sclerotinia sclerotiorum 1980 UF-70]|uniref:Uncharacterized protein n=1 Tax=Sclerotinia sclerotiorum (strain ATCC 18683 / 1980 / Ss-1) TaxID=665079 RepID=A7F805_SCLS1|nr:predicted protein [Sclerotinia sclerotiorum 1980 UF-70]EDN98876.1 predicted protein [Sclerotinia sclerotiorum 1980 UF-70]